MSRSRDPQSEIKKNTSHLVSNVNKGKKKVKLIVQISFAEKKLKQKGAGDPSKHLKGRLL